MAKGIEAFGLSSPSMLHMGLLDVCLPARCLACGAAYRYGERPGHELLQGYALCPSCRIQCEPVCAANRCNVCSVPVPRFIVVCERCRREAFAFQRAIAVHRYSGVAARVIESFKFGSHRSLGRFMAAELATVLADSFPSGAPLVPVPSSRASVRRRGFAGALVIARELARLTDSRLQELLRSRHARSQKALSYQDRRANALASLSLRPGAAVPVRAILVDDVLTTGATADSCARRLIEGGAKEVFLLAYAIEY